jgi:PilZ domain
MAHRLRNTGDMGEPALKRTPVGGLVRYARSFYQLLGNRRKFERTPMAGTIFVTCKGSVIDSTHASSCVNVSLHGVGIECPEPLTVGGFVQLHSEDHGPRRLARVRYCVPQGGVYRVGLEFIAEPQ